LKCIKPKFDDLKFFSVSEGFVDSRSLGAEIAMDEISPNDD